MIADNPILNNPYLAPKLHYDTNSDGNLDYENIIKGRRIFKPLVTTIPTKQTDTKEVFEINDFSAEYGTHIINLCRKEVGLWRDADYPNTTRITKELLSFWFKNPERLVTKKLFFAQQEAVETAIWFNEVAEKSNAGQHILNLLRHAQQSVGTDTADQLPRIAFKMATGSGKTVVMACLIVYHYFNRQDYRNDTRFADCFLIVTPGITIKSRLGVLFVDTQHQNPQDIQDYYHIRGLIPANMQTQLKGLNAKLVITNYHTFEPKILDGNKKSPFDGKVDLEGKKIDTDNRENADQVIKRTLSNFKKGSRILVLNDEAHHCYLPTSKSRTTDNEEADENAKAAVWFSGLRQIAQKFQLQAVYDLSATPYYLTGSGYTAYSLFPWVVSDFGLIEAIESGLVKIPFLPESDDTHNLSEDRVVVSMPILLNLYDHAKKELPKKGLSKQKKEAADEGKGYIEKRPELPPVVKGALDQFYNHYIEYDKGIRKHQEANPDLFSPPPVFIVVCSNTSVSKEMYKYMAGYEYMGENGEKSIISGIKEEFSNYDFYTKALKRKPPTLLIDSDALENGEQINEDFKKIFASEINKFKTEYAQMKGQGSIEKITDAEILREIVNTVGQKAKLGSHIRCVVSVSMLTEGWDANTVTHIMGLRAFGSQLLCEQVAGRALRRMSYVLKTYRIDTGEEVALKDKAKFKAENLIEKFPPEYAHIIGIPFKIFKGDGKTPPPPESPPHIDVKAMPERQAAFEIRFPNITSYRVENLKEEMLYDFEKVEDYILLCSSFPLETTMGSAFLAKKEKMKVEAVFERREKEIIFLLAKELLRVHFSDEKRNPQIQFFHTLLEIVAYWYEHKLVTWGRSETKYKKIVFFDDTKKVIDHIRMGINTHLNTSEHTLAVLNHYNPSGSTKDVGNNTLKDTFPTIKSHVNYVVLDSEWEGICAKTLEELEEVETYVKNQFLDFTIPYSKGGKEHLYYPDFIARIKSKDGTIKNLIIEVTGQKYDKAEKTWYVENRWLPAANSLKEDFNPQKWYFIEIANDIRNIRNQLIEKIQSL